MDDASAPHPTIHAWLGGTDALGRWLDAFYDAVERDDLLAPVFGGAVSREHREHVTAWWAEVMGGPADYTEKLGGYEPPRCRTRPSRAGAGASRRRTSRSRLPQNGSQAVAAAAARPATRPENRQPPRKVPSSER